MKPKRPPKLSRSRPTVGLMASVMLRHFPFWLGAVDEAKAQDANLICFVGGSIPTLGRRQVEYYLPSELQAVILYELVDVERLDGLVTWAGRGVNIGMYLDTREMDQFIDRYRALPIVNFEGILPGIPRVVVDTYQGMRELMVHLIEEHHRRRIVLIRGPRGHLESEERYRAYVDTLAAYDLPFDPDLVCPPDSWGQGVGVAMVEMLLKKRHLRPVRDFDALAATEIEYAIGAVQTLQAHGVHVPNEVSVVGFNDRPEAKSLSPAVTVMHKPFYTSGRRAVAAVLDLIRGETVPDRIVVPSQLRIRRSCGCWPLAMQPPPPNIASLGSSAPDTASLEQVLTNLRGVLFKEIVKQIAPLFSTAQAEVWAARLLETLACILTVADAEVVPAQAVFFTVLEEALRATSLKDEIAHWHTVFSLIRHHLASALSPQSAQWARVDPLWEQTRILVEREVQRVEIETWLKVTQRSRILLEISQAMMNSLNIPQLMDVLARRLPELNIPSGYIALYEDPQAYMYPQPAPEWSRLILAYNTQGQVALTSEGQRFRSCQLLPADLWPHDWPYAMVAMPLYFGQQQFGFALFGVGPRDGPVYRQLALEISSVLQSLLLLRKYREAEDALRESESRMRTLIENLPFEFWAKDVNGKYILQNLATRRLVGNNVGLTLDEIEVSEALREKWRAEDARVYQGETVHSEHSLVVEGQKRIYHQTVAPVYVDEQIVAVLGIMMDITEQRQMEISLRRAIQAAEEAQQIAEAASRAKSMFLANMSHELRTPLNAVLGFSNLMVQDDSIKEKHREHLGIIIRSSEHLLALINDVLDLSKVEAGRADLHSEIFDLHQLLLGLGEMFSLQAAQKGLTVVFDFSPDLPRYVRADSRKLRQVLINLLGNAVKFTEWGGITLRVSLRDENEGEL